MAGPPAMSRPMDVTMIAPEDLLRGTIDDYRHRLMHGPRPPTLAEVANLHAMEAKLREFEARWKMSDSAWLAELARRRAVEEARAGNEAAARERQEVAAREAAEAKARDLEYVEGLWKHLCNLESAYGPAGRRTPVQAGQVTEVRAILGRLAPPGWLEDRIAREASAAAEARAKQETTAWRVAREAKRQAHLAEWDAAAPARRAAEEARVRLELEREAEAVARRTAAAEVRATSLAKARARSAEVRAARKAARKAEREARAAEEADREHDHAAFVARVREAYDAYAEACDLHPDDVEYGAGFGVAVSTASCAVPMFRTDRRRNGRLPHEDGAGNGWDDVVRATEG